MLDPFKLYFHFGGPSLIIPESCLNEIEHKPALPLLTSSSEMVNRKVYGELQQFSGTSIKLGDLQETDFKKSG